MAIGDAYATAAEYRARTGKTSTSSDALILAQLNAVTQFLAKKLNRFFTKDASPVARTYNGNGRRLLWLPDDISSVTGLVIKVDEDADGSFADETALDINTDFRVGPPNAALGPEPEPFEYIEVLPHVSSRLSIWPEGIGNIEITAAFGYPAIPPAIREATVSIAHQLRDIQTASVTAAIESVETGVSMNRELSRLVNALAFRYWKPVVA